jgi:hypothetical protein
MYFQTINIDVIAKNKDIGNVWRILYRNRHRNLILFNELDQKFLLDLPMLKMLTGDDIIPVTINGQERQFKGQFKILLNTNFIPEIGSIENRGIWDRIRVLITQPPIPEGQRIDEFYKSFIDEKDQILTYLIDTYFVEVMASGLREQPKIMSLTKAYKEFEENPVEFFFDRTCRLVYLPLNKAQHIQARYLYGEYFQFHLLISKSFDKLLKIRGENESRKVLVSPVSEVIFSKKMEALGAFRKKNSEMYYENIFFSVERIYSELGEKVESSDLQDFKETFIEILEKAYVHKRQNDEFLTPLFQAKAMGQMPAQTENHFEDPKPAGTIDLDNIIKLDLFMKCMTNNKK